jgi:hypothetical protein
LSSVTPKLNDLENNAERSIDESRFYLHEVTQETKLLEEAFVTNLGQNPASPKGVIQTVLKKSHTLQTADMYMAL